MIEYRDYQERIIDEGSDILNDHGFLYLTMEVRTGKTLTSLGICEKVGAKRVVFLTKKKAISSITDDSDKLCPSYEFWCINYESMHKLPDFSKLGGVDVLVIDEAHSCFLGDTVVGGVKIKDIKEGDYQKSFNFTTQEYEEKKVLNVFKKELTENLVRIKCNGKKIVCTESHEIFTKRGWVKAKDITTEDELQMV